MLDTQYSLGGGGYVNCALQESYALDLNISEKQGYEDHPFCRRVLAILRYPTDNILSR